MSKNFASILIPALLIAFSLAFQSVTDIGFEGWNDDARYVEAAVQWRDNAPYVGHDHWSLRHSYVLPLAGSMKLFRGEEFALSLPSLCAYLGIIVLTFFAIRPAFGALAGGFCAIVLAITPIFAVTADAAMVWQVELLLVLISFWLLWYARDSEHAAWLALLAGVFAGLALLSRASSGAYIVGLGILFLVGLGPARRHYLIAALGCLAVLSVDVLYFKIMTDDWLYRLKIITNHGKFTVVTHATETIDLQLLEPNARHLLRGPRNNYSEYALLDINDYVNPYLMLIVHYYYGATYWLGAAGVLSMRRIRERLTIGKPAHQLLAALLVLAATWYLVGLYVLALRPHPRYWGLTSYVAALFAGLLFAWLWQQGRRGVVALVLAAVLVTHLLLVEMNASSVMSHRWLADYVKQTGHTVHMEAESWRHGQVYFSLVREVGDRLRPLPDPEATRIWVNLADELPDIITENPEQWALVWERRSRVTWLGRLLDQLGILQHLPSWHRNRLVTPDADVVLYERKSY